MLPYMYTTSSITQQYIWLVSQSTPAKPRKLFGYMKPEVKSYQPGKLVLTWGSLHVKHSFIRFDPQKERQNKNVFIIFITIADWRCHAQPIQLQAPLEQLSNERLGGGGANAITRFFSLTFLHCRTFERQRGQMLIHTRLFSRNWVAEFPHKLTTKAARKSVEVYPLDASSSPVIRIAVNWYETVRTSCRQFHLQKFSLRTAFAKFQEYVGEKNTHTIGKRAHVNLVISGQTTETWASWMKRETRQSYPEWVEAQARDGANALTHKPFVVFYGAQNITGWVVHADPLVQRTTANNKEEKRWISPGSPETTSMLRQCKGQAPPTVTSQTVTWSITWYCYMTGGSD